MTKLEVYKLEVHADIQAVTLMSKFFLFYFK